MVYMTSSHRPRPFQRWFVIIALALATINPYAKFEISISTRYGNRKTIENVKMGCFGAIRGHL